MVQTRLIATTGSPGQGGDSSSTSSVHEAMRVFETVVVARPFCTLRATAREHSGRPAVLIVTPFSGQRVAIFGDLIEALAPTTRSTLPTGSMPSWSRGRKAVSISKI